MNCAQSWFCLQENKIVSAHSMKVFGRSVSVSQFITNIVWMLLLVKNANNIHINKYFKPLKPELNPICYLLA